MRNALIVLGILAGSVVLVLPLLNVSYGQTCSDNGNPNLPPCGVCVGYYQGGQLVPVNNGQCPGGGSSGADAAIGGIGVVVGIASFALATMGGKIAPVDPPTGDKADFSGVDASRPVRQLRTQTQALGSSQSSPQIPCSGLKAQIDQIGQQLRINAELIRSTATSLNRQAVEAKMEVWKESVEAVVGGVVGLGEARVLESIQGLENLPAALGTETFNALPGGSQVARIAEWAGTVGKAREGFGKLKDAMDVYGAGTITAEYLACKRIASDLGNLLTEQQFALNKLRDLTENYVGCLKSNPGARELIQQDELRQKSLRGNRAGSSDFAVSAPGSPIEDP